MNNKKRILILEIIGAFVVIIGSFLFHFLYEWSGYNFIVGLFAATNESVFQHIKIVFIPFVLYSIIDYFFLGIPFKRFVTAKSIGALLIYVLVIVFFYTYSGILGYHIAIVDILSVLLYAGVAAYVSYLLFTTKRHITKAFYFVFPLFLVILGSLILFSIYPPQIQLFYDTMNKTYFPVKS